MRHRSQASEWIALRSVGQISPFFVKILISCFCAIFLVTESLLFGHKFFRISISPTYFRSFEAKPAKLELRGNLLWPKEKKTLTFELKSLLCCRNRKLYIHICAWCFFSVVGFWRCWFSTQHPPPMSGSLKNGATPSHTGPFMVELNTFGCPHMSWVSYLCLPNVSYFHIPTCSTKSPFSIRPRSPETEACKCFK